MRKFIEYDRESGNILSAVIAPGAESIETDIVGALPVPDGFQCDPSLYVVRNGAIVRKFDELEKLRVSEERRASAPVAINALAKKYLLALLFGDAEEAARARSDAEPFRIYFK